MKIMTGLGLLCFLMGQSACESQKNKIVSSNSEGVTKTSVKTSNSDSVEATGLGLSEEELYDRDDLAKLYLEHNLVETRSFMLKEVAPDLAVKYAEVLDSKPEKVQVRIYGRAAGETLVGSENAGELNLAAPVRRIVPLAAKEPEGAVSESENSAPVRGSKASTSGKVVGAIDLPITVAAPGSSIRSKSPPSKTSLWKVVGTFKEADGSENVAICGDNRCSPSSPPRSQRNSVTPN